MEFGMNAQTRQDARTKLLDAAQLDQLGADFEVDTILAKGRQEESLASAVLDS